MLTTTWCDLLPSARFLPLPFCSSSISALYPLTRVDACALYDAAG